MCCICVSTRFDLAEDASISQSGEFKFKSSLREVYSLFLVEDTCEKLKKKKGVVCI